MSTIITTSEAATSSPFKRLIVRHQLVTFFVLAFAWSWCGWLPLLLAQNGLGILPLTFPTDLFVVLAAFAGPTLSAMIVTAIISGKVGVWQLLRRYVQWRAGIQWYFLALFGFPIASLLVASILIGAPLQNALVHHWPLIFLYYLPQVLVVLVLGPLWEEPGWRGFALPRLQQKTGALVGSIILGTLWAFWHMPAFFIADTLVPGRLAFTIPTFLVELLVELLAGIVLTIVITWVYNNTRGSLLIAMLVHSSYDATNHLFHQLVPAFPAGAPLFIATLVCALLLIAFTKGHLSYRRNRTSVAEDVSRSTV